MDKPDRTKIYKNYLDKVVGNKYMASKGYYVLSEEDYIMDKRSVGKTLVLGAIFLPLAIFGNRTHKYIKVVYRYGK